MSAQRFFTFVALAACVLTSSFTYAQAPTVTDVFAMRQQHSANNSNFATGDLLFWGASVSPSETTYGVTSQCPSGVTCPSPITAPSVRQALYYHDPAAAPPQFYASHPYDSTLTGAWTLALSSSRSFSDGTFSADTTTVVNTPSVGSVALMPFAATMTATTAGLTPTISWTLPSSTPIPVDNVTVMIFDNTPGSSIIVEPRGGLFTFPGEPKSFVQGNQIFAETVSATTTSVAIPGVSPGGTTMLPVGAPILQYGHQYTISVDLNHVRSGASIDSRSQAFFNFTPINTTSLGLPAGAFIYLPSTSSQSCRS
jgi:hypothetical protein